MKLSEQDKQILKELCTQHNVDFDKVIKLIQIEKEFQQRGNRIGVFEELKDVIKLDK